ncbi:polygalacturonase-like isoform X1 [Punica granatum]|uniref:Polygalacturonase-like isoform X1 n=1 Tax=Punica granatum TaxID=22663 RepID=A0A6P8C6A1_PUNGR|nr:polygalacturonase-like isoform X1 [Punica granatum]XP_031379013.1 polygalacturonase-like isoform X1 [Punica granatum]
MILSRLGMTHPTSMSGGILCDPGQGISVGSLGKARKHETVHAVIVRDVSLAGTMNGVWIKTWQGGRGYVRNILFDRINMIASDHPIIIDQNYRDHEIRCRNQSWAVQIKTSCTGTLCGTSLTEKAGQIMCSQMHPCRDICMEDINLTLTREATQPVLSA